MHNGTVKIGDFGMARTSEELSDPTAIVGTLNYRCPEMILAERIKSPDKLLVKELWTIDTWSFACVIYELFNLEVFIRGNNYQEVVNSMKSKLTSDENRQNIKLKDLNDSVFEDEYLKMYASCFLFKSIPCFGA